MNAPENLLAEQLSPYLLQHAANPVHWRPWGPAALAEAAERDCPILLSVGYAACHWCHVMAHESFEDAATAALMNRLYVNIKVDREERPDVDQIYMSALHAMGEQGGWPLTMFLTPEGAPFWGGTYFPPEARWGRPSFRQVLEGIAQAWAEKQAPVLRNAAALRDALASMSATNPGSLPDRARFSATAAALLQRVDPQLGGLRGAPKFPNPPVFRFLWQEAQNGGDREGSVALHHLLHAMSQGGIYDHLGGGYARYSTDAEWLAPHFEKMLYDNAQILDLLALAQAAEPQALYAERADETVQWLLRDMLAEPAQNGDVAFSASEDADSEGEEGRFYVWHSDEIDQLLGADAASFNAAYDVTPGGNWEGKTILRRLSPAGDAGAEAALARSRDMLLAARAQRIRPGRDDKVLADWNGLAIAALCRAGAVFARPDWVEAAQSCARFVLAQMRAADGRVQHSWRQGRITAPGLLEDQAGLALGAIALFQATGAPDWLDTAMQLARAAAQWFGAADGGCFSAASDTTDLPAGRPRSAADNATPSGNALLAEASARLFHLTGAAEWQGQATSIITAFTGTPERLAGMPALMAAARLLEDGGVVRITGAASASATQDLWQAALAAPNPALVVLPPGVALAHPAFAGAAHPVGAMPSAQLCRQGVCGLPVTDVAALRPMLHPAA